MTMNRKALAVTAIVVTAVGLSSIDRLDAFQPVAPRAVRLGVCEREGESLLGQKPVRVGGTIAAPKKLRDVSPKFPELPSGTTVGGIWLGEALVDTSGKVSRVWPIREIRVKPPFPAFNNAIPDAIRQWEFEPQLVQGKSVPGCMTVTVNINLQ